MGVLTPIKMTPEEYDALPPLIAKGQDREARLNEIVKAWATSYGKTDPDEHVAAGGLVLEKLAFVDENRVGDDGRPEPVDLGVLLRRLEDKLRADGEPEEFQIRRDLHIIIRGCRVDSCGCLDLKIRPRWSVTSTAFGPGASFYKSRFGDSTRFADCEFGETTSFFNAIFEGDANFNDAHFSDGVIFDFTRFLGRASFGGAEFGVASSFWHAHFAGEAHFTASKFGDSAQFGMSTYHGTAFFGKAQFSGSALFARTRFESKALFDKAVFKDYGAFNFTEFSDEASFWGCSFGSRTIFRSAHFHSRVEFLAARFGRWGGVQQAIFGTHGHFRPPREDRPKPAKRARRRGPIRRLRLLARMVPRSIQQSLHWDAVRAIGSLQVLTRVSYTALLVIPILAGVWNALAPRLWNASVNPPAFASGWAIVFFAALFVAIASVIYQVAAPQLVRENSRGDLIEKRSKKFEGAQSQARRDLLQRAFESLARVAEARPWNRHKNLVRRYNETVWIPDDLEDLDSVRDWENTQEAKDEAKEGRRPRFTAEELEMIIIDEGAKAEFDAEAMEVPGSARQAAAFYGVAIYLILWLTIQQIAAVLAAVFECRLPVVRIVDWVFIGTTVVLAAFIAWVWRFHRNRMRRITRQTPPPRPPAPV